MDDIKRLSAFLVALSMFVGNMTSIVVSADEAEAEVQETVSEEAETIEQVETTEEVAEVVTEEVSEQVAENEQNNEAVEEVNEPENHETSNEEPVEEHHEEPSPEIQEQPSVDVSSENEASAVIKGKGDIEGLVNTKVFQVTLPVQGNGLDYVADPQGLISKTDAAKHANAVYTSDSTVYFNNGETVDGNGNKVTSYSGKSSPLTIVNKSSCAVSVVARVSAYFEQDADNPVAISSDNNWENVTKPSIYLSVFRSDDNSEIVLSQREKVLTASIPGCVDAYEYAVDGDEYTYRLKSEEDLSKDNISFSDFSLVMTGECNSEGEWDDTVEYDFPSTSVVWNVGFAVSAKPCINTVEYSVAYSSAIEIPYSLGAFDSAASGIISAEYTAPDGSVVQLVGNDSYMHTTSEIITLTSDFAYLSHTKDGGTVKFKFDDPDQTEISVSLDNNAAPSLDENECSISSSDTSLSFTYSLGIGNKAASGISEISFGRNDFSASAYSSISGNTITISASALRTIQMKNGGVIYVTFDDPNNTRCSLRVNVD